MKRSGNTRKRKRKNSRIARRRLITLFLFTSFLCLLAFAGWQLKNTVFGAIETGEQPVPQTTATSAPATTTTTHPTVRCATLSYGVVYAPIPPCFSAKFRAALFPANLTSC